MKLTPRRLAVAATAVVVVAGGAIAAISLDGPSYPHSWCGPFITAETSKSGTEASLEAALSRAGQAGAPVSQLLSDLAVYDNDVAAANGADGTAGTYDGVFAQPRDLRATGADLKSLAAKCGQPADAYKKWAV